MNSRSSRQEHPSGHLCSSTFSLLTVHCQYIPNCPTCRSVKSIRERDATSASRMTITRSQKRCMCFCTLAERGRVIPIPIIQEMSMSQSNRPMGKKKIVRPDCASRCNQTISERTWIQVPRKDLSPEICETPRLNVGELSYL